MNMFVQRTRFATGIAAALALAVLCLVSPPSVRAQAAQRPFSIALWKFQISELEKGQFQLSFAPCLYKYKTDESDWYSSALLLRASLIKNWELAIGSDFLSHQHPDSGMADLYAGVKWTFYSERAITLAASAYLNFPTGSEAFRNPGIQPTLTLTATHAAGGFDVGVSVGTTYAADTQGEPCYFDLETTVSVDYSLNEKNAFGIFASGYSPDQRWNGQWRLSDGASYTRTISARHALGVTFEKGLSGRGLDWSVTFGYDFTF